MCADQLPCGDGAAMAQIARKAKSPKSTVGGSEQSGAKRL